MALRRRMEIEELVDRPARPRARLSRSFDEEEQDKRGEPAAVSQSDLPEALLALCGRFGIEPWASQRDERGIWGFAIALAGWLERRISSDAAAGDLELESIRLLTNLFIILGAVIRPLPSRPPGADMQACAAVAAARRLLAGRYELVPSFPGAGRAMQRLVRVRGWARLGVGEQALAESLLGLYLESLAAILVDPAPEILLTTSAAWLTVVRLQALPAGFDERLLRATSWYLESYCTRGNRG